MDEILQRLIDDDFSELAGLRVDASIPLSEHLVNEFVGAALLGNKNITSCYIAIHGGNKIILNMKTPFWPLALNLKLHLESLVDFTNGPKIKASLDSYALLGKLGALLKALPPGITMQNEEVIMDVQSFLTTSEQKKWTHLLKFMEFKTEEAKLILNIKVEVD